MKKKLSKNRERAEQQALATLGMYALERNDLSKIMDRAIQQCCIILDLECATIFLLDEGKERLKIAADSGCCGECSEIVNDQKWDVGYALRSDKPLSVPSYQDEDRFEVSPVMNHREVISSVHIAIRGEDDVYGVFGFYADKQREFLEQELNFIQIAANILGMAIERDHSRQMLEDKNKQLQDEMERNRDFQREILNNSMEERWELGGYLHDNLAQMLASAKILISDIEKKIRGSGVEVQQEIDDIKEIIDEGISGIRDLTHDIIPIDLEEDGVVNAIQQLISQTQKLHDVECTLQADEKIDSINDIERGTHIYHIIQEALKNAVTHGDAKCIEVKAETSEGRIIIEVKDDGVGISGLPENGDGDGKGMRIMKHRIELLGGSLEVGKWADEERSGTCLTCGIPFESLRR